MILKLKDGIRYEDSRANNSKTYDPRQQFTRFKFKETEQKFDMEAFQMKRTDENLFKSHHAMLNLRQLKIYTDSNSMQLDSVGSSLYGDVKNFYNINSPYFFPEADSLKPKIQIAAKPFKDFLQDVVPAQDRQIVTSNALGQVRYIQDAITNKLPDYKLYKDKDIRYRLEWHRKFTLAISCLLLFGIGAPLGAIIRKGGLGLPVVVAIIFFLIFHIISTVAEKSAKDDSLSPVLGMWMAIIVLTPLAIFLTYKSTSDSALFDIDQYKIKAQNALNWIKNKLKTNKTKDNIKA